MPIGVTLGVQGLRNHISGQLGLVAIIEMNDVGSCVQDRVRIGEPNWVAIPVTLARGNTSFDQCPATGKHYLGAEVIITHFWCDLSVTVVMVNGVAVVEVVGVRGQVFGREILNRCCRSEMGLDGLIKPAPHVKMNRAVELLVGEVSQGRSAHELSSWLENFGGQSRTNVRGRAEIAAQDQFVIRIRRDVIPVHYPVVPTKFSNMADVSGGTGHDGLRHLACGHINVIARARAHKSFKLEAVVP